MFSYHSSAEISPALDRFNVTPNYTAPLSTVPPSLYVGKGGTLGRVDKTLQ
ncbi:spike base protein, RCAP_Rcc01079 family, partial [Sphingomonas sp. 35-24ZXX]|uniref:spike base protein, RCAP_Rcc01079 family n=1 Tax=Sphingomonas sp. 35-24ZXX TaxID=1545915 RepID=UPI003FA6B126